MSQPDANSATAAPDTGTPAAGGPPAGGGIADAAPPPAGRPAWAPEGLPDHLSGATAEEALKKVFTAFDGYRKKEAEKGPPPKVEDYAFTPSDAIKPFFGSDPASDPVLSSARELAHRHGLSPKQFNDFLGDMTGTLKDRGLLLPPVDQRKEVEAVRGLLGKAGRDTTDAGYQAAIKDFEAWTDVFAQQRQLSPAATGALKAFLDSAAGFEAIMALRGGLAATAGGVVPVGGQAAPGGWTKESLRQAQGDPRNDPRNRDASDSARRYDPAFAASVQAGYRQVYG